MNPLKSLTALFSKKESKSGSMAPLPKPEHSCYYCVNFMMHIRQCQLKKFIGSIELEEARKINQCDGWTTE